jgi:hypothetical protein
MLALLSALLTTTALLAALALCALAANMLERFFMRRTGIVPHMLFQLLPLLRVQSVDFLFGGLIRLLLRRHTSYSLGPLTHTITRQPANGFHEEKPGIFRRLNF